MKNKIAKNLGLLYEAKHYLDKIAYKFYITPSYIPTLITEI